MADPVGQPRTDHGYGFRVVNIRPLQRGDYERVVPLMAELGYPTTREAFAQRAAAVHSNADDAVFVAERDGQILGLVAAHSFEMLHKPGRLGRITALVVTAAAHGRGIGTALLEAAEAHLVKLGCVLLEVTSAEARQLAHAFYKARGYDEKRVRFVKIPGSN